jgi:hypothetical protein
MPDRLRRRLHQVAIALVLLVGTIATVATSPPYTQVGIASKSASFQLDAEHPAALSRFVVRLSAEAKSGAPHVNIDVQVDVVQRIDGGGASPTGEQPVRFIVASTQQGTAALPSPSPGSRVASLATPWQAELAPGAAGIDLPISCRPVGPCERGFWLIATLTDPGPETVHVAWHVSGLLGFSGGAYPSAAGASIEVDAPILIAGAAPQLVASTPKESLVIGPDRPAAAREVEVSVGAAAIPRDGGPIGTLSLDLVRQGDSFGVAGTPPLVRVYPLDGLEGATSSGVQPTPIAPNVDPFAGCVSGASCIRRFLVTIAWTGGNGGAVDWWLTVRRADLVRVWSSPAELSARILRRFDVSTGTPPSTVHLEGEAAAAPFKAPRPQVDVRLAIRTTATDPIVGLLPIPGAMDYEARVIEPGPSPTGRNPSDDTEVRTHIPWQGPKNSFAYDRSSHFRDGRVAFNVNPFVGCHFGQDCGDLTIATIASFNPTGAPQLAVRYHWTLDLVVYSFTDVPIFLQAEDLAPPTGSP